MHIHVYHGRNEPRRAFRASSFHGPLCVVCASRAALGELVSGARVVLFNDRFNRRQTVERALADAGLSVPEANQAMMAAHTTGRGEVRVFEGTDREAAEALRASLAGRDLLVEVERVR